MNGSGVEAQTVSIGLLLVRVVFGLVMAAHGAQKLLGWFGGYGIKATGGMFESIGFRPGAAFMCRALTRTRLNSKLSRML